VLATGNQDTAALRARAEGVRRSACVLVGPDTEVRRHFGFVMVRRDQRRAGVAGEMRDLRIDDQGYSLS
jgi:hypothetical protein